LAIKTNPSLEFDPDRIKAHMAWVSDHFLDMQSHAERSLQKGNYLDAAVWAQIAADFTFHLHPGFYASQTLESLLLQVSRHQEEKMSGRIKHVPAEAPPRHDARPRMLHVITKAYWTGGHTRLLARLISNTSDRYIHNLVSTDQKKALPDWLLSIVKSSGGWYTSLSAATPDLLKRASLLRQLAHEWSDIVFLHVHPFDVLPNLAFGQDGGPPVVLMNHADHVFWLGSSIVDVVADYRLFGQAITLARRGARVSKILPIPLSEPQMGISNIEARERLGIDMDAVVLLTIAAPYKYTPFGGYDFIETITGILSRNRRALLLAVGPASDGRWLEGSQHMGGRIKAVGIQSDLEPYHACADIYLDSFPFGSFTAWLEAGIRSKPVVGLTNLHAPMYTNLDVTPDKSKIHIDSPEEYISMVEKMIAEPEFRREKGKECQSDLSSRHLLPGWNDYFQALMNSLPTSHSVAEKILINTGIEKFDVFLAGNAAYYNADYTRLKALRSHGRHFSFAARCALYLQNLRGHGKKGRLPLKLCTGLYPQFIRKRIGSLFGETGNRDGIPLNRLLQR
jgi:hypothetical protein